MLEGDGDGAFTLEPGEPGRKPRIHWRGAPVAKLVAGAEPLSPQVRALDSDFLDAPQRQRIAARVKQWLDRYLANRLKPLRVLREAELEGNARGLAFRMVETLGCLPRSEVAAQVDALTRAERKSLGDLGLRIGRESLFVPAALKAETARLQALLLATHRGEPAPDLARAELPPLIETEAIDAEMAQALGYRRLESPRKARGRKGRSAVLLIRADRLERIVHRAFRASKAARDKAARDKVAAKGGRFQPDAGLIALAGDVSLLAVVLTAANFQVAREGEALAVSPRRTPGKPQGRATRDGKDRRPATRRERPDADSPFAKLREWQAAE
jgi:ATP-dependent RNA helicase SUPV3L1/SUV3